MAGKWNRIWQGAVLAALTMGSLTGCGGVDKQAQETGETFRQQETEQVQEGYFFSVEEDAPDVEIKYAEEEPYPELAAFLVDYYEIPEEYATQTRYYYNYADLNEDGTEEVVAVVVGDYTEIDIGDPALILAAEADGSFTVLTAFEGIHTPVMISEACTQGWHDIIYQYYGKGFEVGYLVWQYADGVGYQCQIDELEEEMPSVSGVQILSNNLIDDMDCGRYQMLVEPQEKMEEN
jgi:hypothetical protein